MRFLHSLLLSVIILAWGSPVTSDDVAGILLDYRNSFLSYEQKGLDTCPFTYFRHSCSDLAHVVRIEASVEEPPTFCLGVIFSEEFVLTKASCIPITEKERGIKIHTLGSESIAIRSVHLHPDFRRSDLSHNVALLKLNRTLEFNLKTVASCIRVNESVELYAKVQEIDFDNIIKSVEQNTTICSGPKKDECLLTAAQQWCQKKSSTGFLQIRELGKYKMHPQLTSFDCKDNQMILVSDYLPWIREVTKNANLEYDLTNTGFGEKCNKNETELGVCLHIDDCPQTLQNFKALQKSNSLSTCGFDGSNPLTCCVKDDMLKGPKTETVFREMIQQIENCEQLYGEFRRTPEEHQLYSHVAIVDVQDSINCSATLIADRFLLTSAQCIYGANSTSTCVWTGSAIESPSLKQAVHSIVLHPKFSPSSNHNNVAIIKLKHPIQIDSFNVPACLWKEKTKIPSTLDAVYFNDDQYSATKANPWYYSDCRKVHNSHLIPSEICVDHQASHNCEPKDAKNDLCQIPGTGLYANLYTGEEFKPVTYVVGLHSQGFKCDKLGPAIYTRISEYYEWIKSVMYLSSQDEN